MMEENEDAFLAALKLDLGKPKAESVMAEIDFLKNDVIRAEVIANIFVYFFDGLGSHYTSIEVIPVDRNLFTECNLKNTRLYYFGPNIAMDENAPRRSSDD